MMCTFQCSVWSGISSMDKLETLGLCSLTHFPTPFAPIHSLLLAKELKIIQLTAVTCSRDPKHSRESIESQAFKLFKFGPQFMNLISVQFNIISVQCVHNITNKDV